MALVAHGLLKHTTYLVQMIQIPSPFRIGQARFQYSRFSYSNMIFYECKKNVADCNCDYSEQLSCPCRWS